MSRSDSIKLAQKLAALADPARGGTEGERAVAREKLRRLAARERLLPHEWYEGPRTVRDRRPAWTAPASGAAWSFDPQTGAAAGNVKVHRYDSPRSWRIEVDPVDAPGRRAIDALRKHLDR